MRIYLDNAATTPVDMRVTKAMYDWQERSFGNPSSPHHHGQASKIKLEEVRDSIASGLHGSSREIVFTSGGTESNNKAIIGFCKANKEKGNHIIVSAFEHPSVLDSLKYLGKNGFDVSYLNLRGQGNTAVSEITEMIKPNTLLISMMFVNNETGTVFPIEEVGKICKEKNIVFHCDAVQAFGKMALDVNKLNVDLMSFSAHKIYGPKGVGGLYIRDGLLLEGLSFGGGQEANKRAGTENLIGIIGMGKAVELMREYAQEWQRVSVLRDLFEKELITKVPEIKVNGSGQTRSPYISNISFPGNDNQSLLLKFDMAGLSVSVGSACSSGSIKQSHVLKAMNLPEEIINSAIRFSFGRFTTEQEIYSAIEIITRIIIK